MVTSLGISLSLSLAVMSVSNNLGVMTDNSGAVVNLLGHGVTVLGDDVLALLNVGGVHNGIVDLVANLPWHLALVLLGDLVALSVNLIVTLGSARVSSIARHATVSTHEVTEVQVSVHLECYSQKSLQLSGEKSNE